jgi:Centromere protein B dimerisation domain/Peptidase propeptide and YPEB domain
MSMFDLFKATPPEPGRRTFLILFLGASMLLLAPAALAKDGDGGSGSGNSGSGSDNSGKGNNNDDDGDDDDDRDDDDDDDNDDALQQVSTGNAASLSSIMAEVKKTVPGKVLKVKLRRRFGTLTYELVVLSATGTYYAVAVNAQTRAILSVREK